MTYKDFDMFEEWNKKEEERKSQAAIPRLPVFLPASWWKRFWAYMIDGILLGIPLSMFAFGSLFTDIAGRMDQLVDPVTGRPNQAAVQYMVSAVTAAQLRLTVAFLVVGTAYYVLMHGLRGQTLGKMVLGITVVRLDGTPIDIPTALKRAIVFPIIGSLPYVGGLVTLLNGLSPLWDERNRSLGDKLAGTMVGVEQETRVAI